MGVDKAFKPAGFARVPIGQGGHGAGGGAGTYGRGGVDKRAGEARIGGHACQAAAEIGDATIVKGAELGECGPCGG